MIWLLACTPEPEYFDPPVESRPSDSPSDSPDDTGGIPFEDVEPGPDCSDNPWPIETPWNVLAHRLTHGRAEEADVAELEALWAYMQDNNHLGPAGERLRGPFVDLAPPETHAQLEGISVPEAVAGPDGDLWLVYVDGDVEGAVEMAREGRPMPLGVLGFVGLGVARSSDGLSWDRQELTVDWAGSQPLAAVVDPDVQRLADGSYRLYALAFHASQMCADADDPYSYPSPHEAVTFVSTDLLRWDYEGVVWSTGIGTDPGTWCAGQTCWLHMETSGVSTDGGASFVETSLGLPHEDPQLVDVRPTEQGFEMLYKRVTEQDLWRASSPDGQTFEAVEALSIEGDSPTAVNWRGQAWVYTKERF
jgi:hypothetical protein